MGTSSHNRVDSTGTGVTIRAVAHGSLTADELSMLRVLFDSEYYSDYGPWNPESPYGYSPAHMHIIASGSTAAGERIIGHVGLQCRTITVGGQKVTVAGTGGVLVTARARGTGLGLALMRNAQQAMRAQPGIEFGYLGCRPAVVPFYESAGWVRIHATERYRSPRDGTEIVQHNEPILICSAGRDTATWPCGSINLRGGTW